MEATPIPQRIPPLRWRDPALVWTPMALAAAIGWPALIFFGEPALQRLALAAAAGVFTLALLSLAGSWMIGRPPRTRRTVVMHVVVAGGIGALATPFMSAGLGATALALLPLSLLLGLPSALVAGMVFAWIALAREPSPDAVKPIDEALARHDVQPFR